MSDEIKTPEVNITAEQKTKLVDALGQEMVNKLVIEINKIETGVPITKNNYGAYMSILSRFGKNKILIANLLIILGANKEGVKDALKLS